MENSEMKVTELLEGKRNMESKLSGLESALSAIDRSTGDTERNFPDTGTASIYTHRHEYRFQIDSDLIKLAVEQKIKRLESELEPIQKKLDAIELMLNS